MYVIKQNPDDFFVEEITKLKSKEKGDYLYFILEKKGWNTLEVLDVLARKLKVSKDRFNVAGIKDKNAFTRQYVSVRGVSWDNLNKIVIKNVKLSFFGYGDERIKLGQLKKNRFRIIVRDLEKEYDKISFIENYFDEQRFSGKNVIIGRALVKREFRKVCFNLRLSWNRGDYVNAIRKIGNRMLRFYINSYQSYLWNKAVCKYLKKRNNDCFEVGYSHGSFVFCNKETENIKIPVVGFLTELNGELAEIYKKILKEERIKKEDFLIKEIKEISSEGNTRNLIEKFEMNVTYAKDETRKNRLKAILEFELSAGSYATIVVKKMFHQPL